MDKLSVFAAGALLGIVTGVMFTLLFPPVMPSVADVSKPACSPMFEIVGESGVFGCIHGNGLNGKFAFVPCTGPVIDVDVERVRTTKFTCSDEAYAP
ncbi:hypothetical protein EHH54_32500 [Rhizobium leguminosarum]|uniref:hypothetical protein n=1 Tax=Rhizobium leguminosarum TaxID=384 RepID=UPI000FEC6CDD|nr:hypothetical protein [Rhizobium leguminosarum]RWX28474.1 hypothetical protein EHH54_32500 [Rhizobium leguminosarum]